MKFIIDKDIPYIKGVLEPCATVAYLPGAGITRQDVRDADALIIRTRTRCDASLLEGSAVRFIATATIGYDHIDTAYCEKANIGWTNAEGCNAGSVAQYVTSALFVLAQKQKFNLSEKTIGIVGVGNVGKRVEEISNALGMNVLLNDPPRERREGRGDFVSLEQICAEADIITFHTPLIRSGRDCTRHIVNEHFLSDLIQKPILINTARGEIADTIMLKKAMKTDKLSALVLDCWENEPDIDIELLEKTDIATPHIAGYSADGKANATALSVQAVSRFFHLGLDDWTVKSLPSPSQPVISVEKGNMSKAILHAYDIMQDDGRLRENPRAFESLRNNYPLRREYGAYSVEGYLPDLLMKIGFR